MDELLDAHFELCAKGIIAGRLIPFFGAGVNLCGRPPGLNWRPEERRYLPSGAELSGYLADTFAYPSQDRDNLVRVSQYAAVMSGPGPLYDELHSLLDDDYPPTDAHRFFASLPTLMESSSCSTKYQLIITTNYDDLMERALQDENIVHDLVVYASEGDQRGRFVHQPPGGPACPIEIPNEYLGLALDKRPTVLKIHGAVARSAETEDSYVITEDDYIEYLTRTDLSSMLPAALSVRLSRSHFLFLGYSLRDWNLRVMLHRIWGAQTLKYKSWAVQLKPDVIEQEFWARRGVEIIDMPLEDYLSRLKERVCALCPTAGGTG